MAVPSNVKVAQTAFSIYLLIVGVLIEFFPALVHTLILLVPGCQDVPTPEGDMFAGVCAMFYQYIGIMYLCMLDNEEFVAWSVTGRLVFVNGLLLKLVAHGRAHWVVMIFGGGDAVFALWTRAALASANANKQDRKA